MSDSKTNAGSKDRNWIVTENGQRSSGNPMTHEEAVSEADRRRRLQESSGKAQTTKIEVKQNIMG